MTDVQINLDLGGRPSAGEILKRIRAESRDESEKGRWFEQLFMRIALQQAEFEIDEIWRWPDWPEREALTGLDGRDIGIDLVAKRTSGELIAIQCKCYEEGHILGKGEIDKFLGGSQQEIYLLRWIVATCRWGPNAERAILNAHPQVTQVDFREYLNVQVEEQDSVRPIQDPWPLQDEAIEDTVTGLGNHDRGRLIMACGTGKTFTSLRIAEQVVEDGQRILFTAPTIALVSQARREWLRQTTRKLECLVVCSDPTAGGRNENEDIRVSELECPVTTDPARIAATLTDPGPTRVVFCTYHSLGRVTEAQEIHNAPEFDLAIADEAHRTTGAQLGERRSNGFRKVDFQEFHDEERLRARKRLYMTATPRIYTQRSKRKLAAQGIEVVDMGDLSVYGPQFHHLPFSQAVEHGMLSDYRVIVLGVSSASVTPGLRRRLEDLETTSKQKNPPSTNEMTRVLGVSLAVNGVTEGTALEQPGKLPRTIAFANSIARSKWYADALTESEVLRATTRRMKDGRAMKVTANHLDASNSALQRNMELRALAQVNREDECRLVCNVKLFTEGVDVPSLDAVAFLDPRDSQVDVVQAVGRVMRKAPGKRFGYIIVPVIVEPGSDVAAALERGTEGYQTVGRVLRALQAHDGRLAESPATFVKVYEQGNSNGKRKPPGIVGETQPGKLQQKLDLEEAEQGIYAQVAAASGLGRPGQIVADEIVDAVRHASNVLQEEGMEGPFAEALDLVPEDDGGAKGICTIAALILCNACLLQRRLRDEPEMKTIIRLDSVAGSSNPREMLVVAWEAILEKDYAPVFRPALAALAALSDSTAINIAIRVIAECANRVADSLSDLGHDHAGPLYHRILGSAKSDGAFYTNNLSAMMLARLALSEDFIDWSDSETVSRLRIMDPACGTGSLLMATLKTMKDRIEGSRTLTEEDRNRLHRRLVEDALCGLDINQHGIQLAACNMTLGAPTVDYARMNLFTMPHGPQSDGTARAGSLDILDAAEGERDLRSMAAPVRSLSNLEAEQVNELAPDRSMNSESVRFPLRDLDVVIMNAPFTDNRKRSRKFSASAVREMQRREIVIRNRLMSRDPDAARVITANSISTFFTPLAERLLKSDQGVLAKVLPVTGCTGASGLPERRFLAERFHIERIVTTHDPKRINFSENTSIHECLLICRRRTEGEPPPTEFVSLRRMPGTADEAVEAADAIASGRADDWGKSLQWPAKRVRSGDWTPAQWYDGNLAEIVQQLENNSELVPAGSVLKMGATGRAAQDSWKRDSAGEHPNQVFVFDSVSAEIRRTMLDAPEQAVVPGGRRAHLYENVLQSKGNLMLSTRYDTVSGRVTALWSEVPTFGFGWIPAQGPDRVYEQALCAWWNSTVGRLLLLNRRAKKLTYPKWSVEHLTSLPCPKPETPGVRPLAEAWQQNSSTPLLPLRQAEECAVRKVIDDAAAVAIGAERDVVTDWRLRLAAEPTITNQRVRDLSVDKESKSNR